MNEKDNRAWWYGDDTTSEVPGYMVPESHPVPYWSSQLLSPAESDAVYHEVIGQYSTKQLHRVYTADGKGSQVDLNARHTHSYDFYSLQGAAEIERRINAEVERCAQTWWGKTSTPTHSPQILGYEERCKFLSHCDNSIWNHPAWMRNDPLRDISGILYVSDCVALPTATNQYSGGHLVMDNIHTAAGPVRVFPQKGKFVAFPSHPMYRHQVTPVVRGYRVAFVNWWSLG